MSRLASPFVSPRRSFKIWVVLSLITGLATATIAVVFSFLPSHQRFGFGRPTPFTSVDNPFAACTKAVTPPPDATFPVDEFISTLCGGLFSPRATALGHPSFKTQWVRQLPWWHSDFQEFKIGRDFPLIVYGLDVVSTRPISQWFHRFPQSGSWWWDCGLNPTIAIDLRRHVYPVCGVDRRGSQGVSFVRVYAVDSQGQALAQGPIYESLWPATQGVAYSEFFLFNGRTVWDLRLVKWGGSGLQQMDSVWYGFDHLRLVELFSFVALRRAAGAESCISNSDQDCLEEVHFFGSPWRQTMETTFDLVGRRQQFSSRHGSHQVDISSRLEWDDSRWAFHQISPPARATGIPW